MYGVQSSKSFLVGHRHIEIIGSSKEWNKNFYGTFDTHGVPVIIMDFKMSSSFHVQVYRMFTP